MNALIVDDIKQNVYILDILLRGSGFQIFTAGNGMEALEILEKQKINIIISDILMPKMDGFQLCYQCKSDEKLSNIPFVFYTATYTSKKDEKFALDIGADKFILKPAEPELILKEVLDLIEKSKKGILEVRSPAIKKDTLYLKEYNLRLQAKFDHKLDELEKSQQLFKSIFESASDAIISTDREEIIIKINPAGQQLFGYTEKELTGKPNSILHPENIQNERTKVIAGLRKGEVITNFETICKTKDRRNIPVEISASSIKNASDQITGFTFIIRDNSERKKAERKLKESEERFKNLFEFLGDAVFVTKLGGKDVGRILEANPAAEKQTGYTREELLQMNVIDHLVVSGSGKVNTKELEELLIKGNTVSTTEKKRKKNGTEYWVNVVITQLKFKGKNASLSINHDITEEIKAQKKLLIAKEKAEESNRLKTAFLQNISHEIRTPMNGILGFTNLLKEPRLADEQRQAYIDIITQSSKRMLNTVNDLMDISFIDSGQVELKIVETNINEIIGELYAFFKPEVEKKGMQLFHKMALPYNEAVINTDQEKVVTILNNLIKNAIKYSEKGTIEFGYTKTDKKPFKLRFYVKDTGIGIPKAQQKAIFDRFVQADLSLSKNYEGSGLGLSICEGYVKMLGGRIWVESELGKGSTFYFNLPFPPVKRKNNYPEKFEI